MAGVALFDFDGTISKKSSIVPFYVESSSWGRFAVASPSLVRHGCSYALKGRTFEQMMALCTELLLKRVSLDQASLAGASVASSIMSRDALWMQPLAMLRRHIEQGDEVAIVTGGYPFVAESCMNRLGLHGVRVFASELVCDHHGIIVASGSICVGAQKLSAVHWARERGGLLSAYGNSRGDLEMLHASDVSYWVDEQGAVKPFQAMLSK